MRRVSIRHEHRVVGVVESPLQVHLVVREKGLRNSQTHQIGERLKGHFRLRVEAEKETAAPGGVAPERRHLLREEGLLRPDHEHERRVGRDVRDKARYRIELAYGIVLLLEQLAKSPSGSPLVLRCGLGVIELAVADGKIRRLAFPEDFHKSLLKIGIERFQLGPRRCDVGAERDRLAVRTALDHDDAVVVDLRLLCDFRHE